MSPVSGQLLPPSSRPAEPGSKKEERVEANPTVPKASRPGPEVKLGPKPGPMRVTKTTLGHRRVRPNRGERR